MGRAAIAVLGILATAGCGVEDRSTYEVVYELTGSGTVDLSSIGPGPRSLNAVALPWTYRYEHADTRLLSRELVAQGRGDTRDLACRITVNGKSVAEHSADGGWAIVACVTRPID